jgi:hypothetical protein
MGPYGLKILFKKVEASTMYQKWQKMHYRQQQ